MITGHVEKLPEAWERVEASVMRRLVPGPGQRILPVDLRTLREILQRPAALTDLLRP